MYVIKRSTDPSELQMDTVACYPWGCSYRPRTEFRIGYDDKGIHVFMTTWEKHPKADCTERNGEVWFDSCMEFFVEPVRGKGYFNCELNSHPAMLLCFGTGTGDDERDFVDWPTEDFDIECTKTEDTWSLHYCVPFAMLKKYVPEFEPKSGTVLHTNVFKCGDKTEFPHFGCHYPIEGHLFAKPEFHAPQYFGEMVLE